MPDAKKLYEKQNGCCPICKKALREERLTVDFSFDSFIARGLLCRTCKTGVDAFESDPTLLKAAIKYLETWNK